MIDSSKWSVRNRTQMCTGEVYHQFYFFKEGKVFYTMPDWRTNYGAAVVVMAFDEEGQADTIERKR